jgi:hypothetical protein
MENQATPKGVFIGIVALCAILLALYFFLAALLDKLNEINSDLIKTLVGATIAAVGAAITIVLGKAWELKTKIKQEIREKKIPIYEEQLHTIFKVLFDDKIGRTKLSEKELLEKFAEFSEKLVIWGSPTTIRAWNEFREFNWEGATPENALQAFGKFMIALRKDLGNSNAGVAPTDLLRLFINDIPK